MKKVFISILTAVLLVTGGAWTSVTQAKENQQTLELVNKVTIEDITTGAIGYASNTIEHIVSTSGIGITQTFDPATRLEVGDLVTITTIVRNNDDSDSYTGVRIKSEFDPSQIEITNILNKNCIASYDAITCDLGTLMPLSETTVVFTGRVTASGAIAIDNTVNDLTGLQSQAVKTFNARGSYIESLRLAGNKGLAQGVSDDLYVRLNGVQELESIADIELSVINGAYHYVDEIPVDTQHYNIAIDDGEMLQQLSATTDTALLKIPFTVPVLQDLTDGAYTLKLVINKVDLNTDIESIVGLLPVQIGQPMPGDAEVDWDVDLVDTVIAMRFVDKVTIPTDFAKRATDINTSAGIQIGDVFEIF